MRITVPVIGTIIAYNPTNGASGDPNDPIRIDVDLGNVSWQLVSLDIETGLAEIEVSPAEEVAEDTGQVDGEGKPIFETRPTTETEKQALLDNAEAIADVAREDGISKLKRRD